MKIMQVGLDPEADTLLSDIAVQEYRSRPNMVRWMISRWRPLHAELLETQGALLAAQAERDDAVRRLENFKAEVLT